ncbi:hypothetical protein J5X84_44025 [Streptosporangiaceae bacterium NEAU-GS5]|nr:hypothetical protein [Streptosporangiaceae bacterium NEAU-GS5]
MHLQHDQQVVAHIAAEQLRRNLAGLGVVADLHSDYGLALLSVWTDLVVWTDGHCFRWWAGRTSIQGRKVYAFCPANDTATAARRVARRYVELRTSDDAQS